MATSIKISQLPAKGSNLEATDLLEVSEFNGTGYVSKSITGAEIAASAPAAAWGTITGTLSSQTDLNTALSGKQATVTLTTTGTSGASTFVANTLNVPTYSLSGLGGVPTTRTISTTSPLSGGGDLSANRTLSIATANTTTTGALSSTDWNTFNGKQATLVSGTNIKTINGTTLLGSGDLVVGGSSAIAIGTTAITSGTVGRVLFEGTGNVVQESANLFWDNTNGRLGVGTASPSNKLDISGNATGGNPTRLGITNTGASGVADLFAFNDTGRFLGLQMFGSTATSTFAGINNANLAKFVTNNTFVVGTSGSNPLVFAMNGSVLTGEVARFSTNSNFLINTTTDAGYKLDVNGTARVQGDLTIGSGNGFLRGTVNVVSIFSATDQAQVFSSSRGALVGTLGYFGNTELKPSGGIAFSSIGISQSNAFVAISQGNTANTNPESFVVNRGFFSNIGATDKNILRISSTLNSNLSNATLLRGVYIDINDTTTYTGFSSVRAIEAPRGGAYFNTTSVNSSAVLQADSTTQGFLPPRMTTTQKNAIASPATGLMVYDTTLNVITYYNGTTWI